MRNLLVSALMALMLAGASASAGAASIVEKHVPDAAVVGQGSFHYLFMHIYDIRLMAEQGEYDPKQPYALELTYQRDLDGKDIAAESIKQMRKQGWNNTEQLQSWQRQMDAIFPDVRDGTVLTGIRDASGKALFYEGEARIGVVDDPVFSDAFFGIWLSRRTTEPKLRATLLGDAP